MLGYALLAFAYGVAKSRALGARRAAGADLGRLVLGAAAEEVQFRGLYEHLVLPALGATPRLARLATSGLFGYAHVDPQQSPSWGIFRAAEAALGGLAYSVAYAKHGLLGAIVTHMAHNLGTIAGSKEIPPCA